MTMFAVFVGAVAVPRTLRAAVRAKQIIRAVQRFAGRTETAEGNTGVRICFHQ